jgi:hypothetical protein
MVVTFLFFVALASLAFSQDKKDTIITNPITINQTSNKGLAKQSRIVPKVQSNWSKIKDLFM